MYYLAPPAPNSVAALENQHKEVKASLSNVMSACSAVPIMEQTINTRMPDLEASMRKQDLELKATSARVSGDVHTRHVYALSLGFTCPCVSLPQRCHVWSHEVDAKPLANFWQYL